MMYNIVLECTDAKIVKAEPTENIVNLTDTSVTVSLSTEILLKIYTDLPVNSSKCIIRLNGFLINFWLANIKIIDNQIYFPLDSLFYKKYNAKDIQGRLNSLGNNPSTEALDHNIGRNLHPELVNNIKSLINEKRRTIIKSAVN